MKQTTVTEPVTRPRLVHEGRITARIWKCSSCGLKLFLAQKSEYPSIRCLCGRSYWQSCPETDR
ncbi:MAG: hypothetical protein E6X17_10685 [Sporomusaceae bacterium]|nr:hypothetical protein [Sporomusaceae bacterium]